MVTSLDEKMEKINQAISEGLITLGQIRELREEDFITEISGLSLQGNPNL